MSKHIHHVSGRLRVRVHGLKNCQSKAAAVTSAVAAVHGVTRVRCNSVAESLTIHYQPGVTDLGLLERTLECDRISTYTASSPNAGYGVKNSGVVGMVARKALHAALMFAVEKAAERTFVAVLSSIL